MLTLDASLPIVAPGAERLLRWPQVKALVGLSRTTVWRLVRAGAFPAPVKLSGNAIAWRASAVSDWIASRTPTRTSGTPTAHATPLVSA